MIFLLKLIYRNPRFYYFILTFSVFLTFSKTPFYQGLFIFKYLLFALFLLMLIKTFYLFFCHKLFKTLPLSSFNKKVVYHLFLSNSLLFLFLLPLSFLFENRMISFFLFSFSFFIYFFSVFKKLSLKLRTSFGFLFGTFFYSSFLMTFVSWVVFLPWLFLFL